jgi:predicted GIY-YIG superfamily endonuclease
MTLSDKRRAASINEQVRTKETPVTQTAKEHLIEDVRQAPVVAKTTHSKEYYTMVKNLAAEKAMVIKMIEEASRDPSSAEFFGNERVQYWRNRAFSLVGQVEQMVKNELVRWDQGALNAGVAISTDNRSQSMRKMSAQEFNNYIQPKKMQMIEPFMKEAQEEVRRAEIKQAEIKKQKEAIITARNQPQTHSQETQELMQYNSWYEGETAAWFNTIQQDRNLMPKLRSSPVMNRITEYLDYPVTRRAKIMKDFGDKKLIMGKPMSLTAAKAEIEHAWKSVIPLAVSEVQKVEPTYTAQARPIPTNLKQNLLPQGSSLGAAGVSRNITIHPTRQLRLSGIDNHRRSGRPILSEQQGTRGLAGLFPALRSSMQGALKR